MSVNIMIAGCSKDERDGIDASVRAAFKGRPDSEPWNVSLVNLANQWSIDIDGPEPRFKGMSLVAPANDLTGSLERAIQSPPPAASSTPTAGNGAAPARDGTRKDRHECEECAAAFEVIFDKVADEPEELCPVACPACWHVNKVPIAEAAGATGDYRAEAVG